MKLIVAADDNQMAQGSLFWDDGESIGECSIQQINLIDDIFYHITFMFSIIVLWKLSTKLLILFKAKRFY